MFVIVVFLESGSELIETLKTKLGSFTSPIKTKIQSSLTDLKTKWKTLTAADRTGVGKVLTTIVGNIDKFGDSGSNPVGAIQGAINIVGSVSSLFGPTGQLVSIGLSFISGLLGLFGKGPKPKPIAEVVREQIDQALAKYRFETLTDKGKALIDVYQRSLSYLDGPFKKEGPINKDDIKVAACRVQLDQGNAFIDELGGVIKKMFEANKADEAKKCIVACELYAQLAALKDMVMTQMLTMSSGVMEGDASGLLSSLETHRQLAKNVLEPLFTADYTSKIVPYFDPDVSVATGAYATGVLNIGKYPGALSGMHCLSSLGKVKVILVTRGA